MEEKKVTAAEVVNNAAPSSSSMPDSNSRTMALIIWLTSGIIIIPLIFMLLDTYKKDKYIQFHAWESLLFGIISFLVTSFLGWTCIVPLLVLVVWVVGMVKAYQGEYWMLPVIGDISMKQAEAASAKASN